MKLNLIINKIYIPFKNGKLNLRTGKLEPIVKEDYLTFTMNYEYTDENRNEELINKYHQIYVDIFEENAEEVERFIAYSMTGEIKYSTNFLFNLGRKHKMVKVLLSHMYQKVLPLYWDKISKNTFSYKNTY